MAMTEKYIEQHSSDKKKEFAIIIISDKLSSDNAVFWLKTSSRHFRKSAVLERFVVSHLV